MKTKKNKEERQDKLGGELALPLFRNRVKICVEGFNQNRLLSALTLEGIRICTLKKRSNKLMDIVIDTKNRQKAIAIIQKMCYNHSIGGSSGFEPISKWLLSRIGIFVGIVAFVALAVVSSAFIWRIDISGNAKVDSLTIMRELKDASVSVGKSKSFDTFVVKERIVAIDGIVECTIEVVGTTVRVKVIEAKDFIAPNTDTTPADIVSSFDAEVTRITVSAGTGKVGIGDRVAAGSVLISGEVLNTQGEVTGEVRARGEVFGKVYFFDSAIICTTVEKTERTGKKSVFTSLELFGLKLAGKSKNRFAYYETVTTHSYAFYNTFLPIEVHQTTYYEIEKKLIERPIDEMIDEYKRDKLLSLIINAGGSEIATTITKQELASGLYRVSLYMEAEMLIGEYQERVND